MDNKYESGPLTLFLKQISDLQRFKRTKKSSFDNLTDREIEVLVLIAEGMTNSVISEKLSLSKATVQNHRASIRNKLNIKSQADYIKIALAFNLIQF